MARKPKLPREAIAFQPDAVEVDERRMPFLARFTLYLIVVVLSLGIAWAAVSHVDKLISARGKLVIRSQPLVVQPLEISVIRSIDVRVGELVKTGQLLATLDPTFTRSDMEQLRVRNSSLNARVARLEAEMRGEVFALSNELDGEQARLQVELASQREEEHRARVENLRLKKQQLEAALYSNRQDQQRTTTRLENTRDIESMHESLFDAKQGSRMALLSARKDRLELEAEQGRLHDREKETENQMMAAQAELDAYIKGRSATVAQELITARQEQREVVEQLRKAERRSELVRMTASADAVVLEVAKLSAGSVVKEAEPLVTLVPLTDDLEAEVEIDARDIGRIRVGRPARIKLDAWPFQRHGTLEGEVRIISGDAFLSSGFSTKEDKPTSSRVVYRARIKIDNWRLRKVPEHFRPIPGLTLTAEIHVGTQRVIRYFFDPLMQSLDESIREP